MITTATALAQLLDPEFVSRLVGRPARTSRVRIKPDVSLIAAIADPTTGVPTGWLRILWPISHSKAAKTAAWARERNLSVAQTPLADGLLAQWGEIAADPALGPPLARATQVLGSLTTATILRYNPLRRLVVRHGQAVARIHARMRPLDPVLRKTITNAVPTPPALDAHRYTYMAVQRVCGTTDLAAHPDQTATRAAGATLASLHAASAHLPAALGDMLRGFTPRAQAAVLAHRTILRAVAPALAVRAERVARRLPELPAGPEVLAHGDASPDQVLCDPAQGHVWWTDFDRVCLAPAALDLGSYLAETTPELGDALLAGYQEGGGTLPSAADIAVGRLHSLALRLADPLRSAHPQWQTEIATRLSTLEEALR